jgi:RNA polymerase sigma factor (TIGR02999 family)
MSSAGPTSGLVTELLVAWTAGDPRAQEALLPLVYAELRRRAAAHLRRERRDHTLQPTALVHEAYLRLVDQRHVDWRSRAQFFAIASRIMRRVLVDHARTRAAGKRPDPSVRVTLEEAHAPTVGPDCDVLLLDEALGELAALDPRQEHLVELVYFGGLSESEAAAALEVSRSTVARELRSARAWLYRHMTSGLTDDRR